MCTRERERERERNFSKAQRDAKGATDANYTQVQNSNKKEKHALLSGEAWEGGLRING